MPPTHFNPFQYRRNPAQARSRRRFLHTSAAAIAGLSLSSCGWTLAQVKPNEGVSGSKDELYIYTWSSYVDQELLNNFTAQTGIKVKADVFESNEQMLAKIQAGGGAAYSIIYPSDYAVAQMMELGLLRELDPVRIPALENLKAQFRNSPHDPQNRHHVPISWGTTGFIYNADKLNPPPEDWDYLWKHQKVLSKRMTLLNDVREVMGGTLRMLGYSYNSRNSAELEQAYQKLVELKPAIASFTTDAWRDQILAGDLLLAMGYSADGVATTKENPSLRYVIPRSGTSLWSDTMVIPRSAPNVNAAYAWINFMLQPSVAAQVTERLLFATPNQAAYDQLPFPVRDNLNLFPPESLLTKCEGIAPVGKFIEVYDKYWTRLTSS